MQTTGQLHRCTAPEGRTAALQAPGPSQHPSQPFSALLQCTHTPACADGMLNSCSRWPCDDPAKRQSTALGTPCIKAVRGSAAWLEI